MPYNVKILTRLGISKFLNWIIGLKPLVSNFWQFWCNTTTPQLPPHPRFLTLCSFIGLSKTKSISFPSFKLLCSVRLTLFYSIHLISILNSIISHAPSWWLQLPCWWLLWPLRWISSILIGLIKMVQCS